MSRKTIRPRPLDLFRKLDVIRQTPTKEEDEENGAPSMPPMAFKKSDIPAPRTSLVEDYAERNAQSTFALPVSYIRYPKKVATGVEDMTSTEYTLNLEDEQWFRGHAKYGRGGGVQGFGLDEFEAMINILERATGLANIIPQVQAETLFVSQLGMCRALHLHVWTDVYNYWKAKRTRLGKPLWRRYWPVTSAQDTDPHKVFRPREKERYKLRRNRKNDTESFRKLQQLKRDFEKVSTVLEMVRVREGMKKAALTIQKELFEQALYDLTDTSGKPRQINYRIPPEYQKKNEALRDAKKEGVVKSHKKKKKEKGREGAPEVSVSATAQPAAPRLLISALPSFLDKLPTRDPISAGNSYLPQLPTYSPTPGPKQQVRKFLCRARVGRGGRVILDRIPAQDDACGSQALVIYNNATPARGDEETPIQLLMPPLQSHTANDRRVKEICAMEDEQETYLEPVGLGVAGSAEVQKAQAIKYMIRV